MRPLRQELVYGAVFVEVSPDDCISFLILLYATGSSVTNMKSVVTGKQSVIQDIQADRTLWGVDASHMIA